jgi:hypothetical protein
LESNTGSFKHFSTFRYGRVLLSSPLLELARADDLCEMQLCEMQLTVLAVAAFVVVIAPASIEQADVKQRTINTKRAISQVLVDLEECRGVFQEKEKVELRQN